LVVFALLLRVIDRRSGFIALAYTPGGTAMAGAATAYRPGFTWASKRVPHVLQPTYRRCWGHQSRVYPALRFSHHAIWWRCSSSDGQLQQQAEKGYISALFSVQKLRSYRPPSRGIPAQCRAPHLPAGPSAPPTDELLHRSPLLRKLLGFRAISKTEPQPCQH
jgi:hypothetical protein